VLLAATGAVVFAVRAVQHWLGFPGRPLTSAVAEAVEVEIPRGAALPAVLDQLVAAGVMGPDDARVFRLYVLHRGAAGRITAGPHRFTPAMTPDEVLDELMRRQPAPEVLVTVPEGRNLLEVADILASSGIADRETWLATMRDRALLDELEIRGDSVEGYLYPDTYKLAKASAPADVIRRLVRQHRQVFADLQRRHRDAAAKLEAELGWGEREIVILASIIEKETSVPRERPRIASVFLNRLRFSSFTPKLLQTDPTIIYGCTVPLEKSAACQQWDGRIRRIHLRDPDNAYSTYANEGLPPGPIANPGRAALEAVLAPDKTRDLYFVARNDGTHQFSRTVAEHEAWVELYMRQGYVGDAAYAAPGAPTRAP
jgi:UPF0755 protein